MTSVPQAAKSQSPSRRLDVLQAATIAVARFCLGALFIWSGLGKFADLAGTGAVIAEEGLPSPALLALAAACLEVFGAMLLFVGALPRVTALALAAFTIATMFVFHDFWTYPADQAALQQTQFLKNLSIVGGMLMLATVGAGRFSWDAWRARHNRSVVG